MSSIRRKFRVSWADGEPVEIQTNAWDMTRSADYATKPALATFALLHAALDRLGHHPPHSLDDFIEQLDDVEALDDEPTGGDEVGEVPPTPSAPGDGVLLR